MHTTSQSLLRLLLALAVAGGLIRADDITVQIPNQLRHTWPGELVSFDLPAAQIAPAISVEIQGIRRPVQIEEIAGPNSRVWSYVTIHDKDADGEKTLDISTVPARFIPEKSAPGITLAQVGDYVEIDNGTYQFRLRTYTGQLNTPIPLRDLPHWCGGMRTLQQKEWDGRAWFESNAMVTGARTEIVQQGPVFIDFRITYEFAQPGNFVGDATEAIPLALGKQSHLFAPNRTPRETVARLENSYELMLRFVMDDPWIDINERFHFPPDKEASAYGISHYYIEWGKQGLPVDTVSWVRWFEYDRFGGNTNQNYVPAVPRPDQKGRPFALLRPRWNQGGGGAQDFVLTSGGPPPAIDKKTKQQLAPEQASYSPDSPAVGIIATFASKWVGPYANYIPVYALDGDHGMARFPMTDGERSGLHYGQRAFAICVAPRHRLHNLNDIVRRHTDWTLTAQINKYILEWPRDPNLAGPNVLISRDRLKQLQSDWQAGRPTAANDAIKDALAESKPLIDERDAILADYDQRLAAGRQEIETLSGPAKVRDAAKAVKDALKAAETNLKNLENAKRKDSKLASLNKKLAGNDFDLINLITNNQAGTVKLPSSGLWRERRYQDDFLNPTSTPPRNMVNFAQADLFANGTPIGTADQAAMGYIATDLDSWPGWLQGWSPGNPNFHTDKYMAALYVAGTLRDHPHAKEWMQYGRENFEDDARKVFLAPDGVGAECPGYAGYSMKLQTNVARILQNIGSGNLLADNPLVKKNAIWHRKLITPYDFRIGRRHEAPIGDTHRWDSGMYSVGFAKLAAFYSDTDPAFAGELLGTWKLLNDSFSPTVKRHSDSLEDIVLNVDSSIPATEPQAMDWTSQAFESFGAVMRSGFGSDQETFLSFKAGRARGHYHNDENSYHYYADNTPISLDYNCSYAPRGDHAALHNSMTFGVAKELPHNGRGTAVAAQEEISATATMLKFAGTPAADLAIAERRQDALVLRPIDPDDTEFGRDYPSRPVSAIVHRRAIVLVKHPADSPLTDYLVVRDTTVSEQPQQLNIHLLSREISQTGNLFAAVGQYDKDILVYLAEATTPKVKIHGWHYRDTWMLGPEPYILQENETVPQWTGRLQKLMADHQVDHLPLPGWKPQWQDPKTPESQAWAARLAATEGRAMMAPPFWQETWMYGEYQQWLRIETQPGTPITWVLYAYKRGSTPPTITSVPGGARVQLGDQIDEVIFSPDGARISQNGITTEL